MQNILQIKDLLEENYHKYATKKFIEDDPIQIPYLFSKKEDIEISAFLTSIIAWGKRNMIIKNSYKIMELLEYSPYEFIINHSEKDLQKIKNFVHRTFNSEDLIFFITSLKNIYIKYNSLENIFSENIQGDNMKFSISTLNEIFFSIPHQKRAEKHLSNPLKGSASKRINMFLRWMVRKDNVDFGIWKNISTSILSIPLDVHVGNVSRQLGFLTRTQNDWKSVEEIDKFLRILNPNDPIRYDFSLFCLGIEKNTFKS